MQSKIKNQSIIRLHFDIHENSAKHRNDVDSISKTLKIDKCEKSKRNEKVNLINQKFENKRANRRKHKKATKIFN